MEHLEDRVLLAVGPQLISVQPNVGSVLLDGAIRNVAPNELLFVFDEGQSIDSDTLDGIRVKRAGFDNAFDGVSDVIVEPGYIGVDPDQPNEVIVRFAESLPDDLYRLEVFAVDDVSAGVVALRNVEGDSLQPKVQGTDRDTLNFRLDLGAQIIAVVPQPVQREIDPETKEFVKLSQARNQIEIYFNHDELDPASAANVNFYQLIHTNGTVSNLDDETYTPISVVYDAETGKATLTFAGDIGGGPDEPGQVTRPGTYRLRVGTDEARPEPPLPVSAEEDPEQLPPGTSFETARVLGELDQSLLVSGQIQNEGFPLDFPGSSREPGHRDHLAAKDESPGIEVIQYNFKEQIGADDLGNPVFNLITETQKLRAREVFELYSYYLGVAFVETAEDGITIATGDTRYAADDVLVMDGLQPWNDRFGEALLASDPFGETLDTARLSWFEEAMRQVGTALGMVPTPDAPPFNLMGQNPQLQYLVPHTVLQVQNAGIGEANFVRNEHVYPGDFDLVQGKHLHRPESTDLDVYQIVLPKPGVLTTEIIAERLEDSSLLDAVVTMYRETEGQREMVARNDDYFSEDSWLDLELQAGTYYIVVSSTGNVDFDPTVEDSGFGGTSEGPYQLRLDFRPRVDNFLIDTTGTAFDGDGNGVPGGVYNFWFRAMSAEEHVFVDKGAPTEFPDGQGGTLPADGSLERPFNNLAVVLNQMDPQVQSGEILRIVGNGGDDGDLTTLQDNLAYELGVANGRVLAGRHRTRRAAGRHGDDRCRGDLQIAEGQSSGRKFLGGHRSQRSGAANLGHARRERHLHLLR